MANKIMKFISETFGSIRGVYRDGQPWLYAKDVCKILEVVNVSQAVSRLDFDEKALFSGGKLQLSESDGSLEENTPPMIYTKSRGGVKGSLLVNEAGFYSLVLTSRTEAAKEFKRWVTHEVLPSIRRTGEYQLTWQETRDGGKITRRTLTDIISQLYEYAVGRDEYHHPPKFLYSNYTKLANGAVGVESGMREGLTAKELFELDTCEYILGKTILFGMAENKTQHDIYEDCKAKLAEWSALTK